MRRSYPRSVCALYALDSFPLAPGHIETLLRYVALERRRGNNDKCRQLFANAIESAQEESHKVLLNIHLARFVGRTESADAARAVFDAALEKFSQYKSLWHALLSFEKKLPGDDLEERVSAVYDRAVHDTHSMHPLVVTSNPFRLERDREDVLAPRMDGVFNG